MGLAIWMGKLVQPVKNMSGSDPRKKDTHAKSPSDRTEENESMPLPSYGFVLSLNPRNSHHDPVGYPL